MDSEIIKAKLPKDNPLHIHISITTDCNLRCSHCYGSFGFKKTDIPFNFLKKMLYLIKDEVLYVNLSGGEPTRYSDFINLINYLDKIKLPYCLTTNGIFSDSLFEKIKQSNMVLSIKISLDGITSNSHTYIRDPINRNKFVFKKTIGTIKRFTDEGIFVTVGTLVHSKNYNQLLGFPKFLSNLGVKKWVIGPLLKKGRGETNKLDIDTNKIYKLFANKSFLNKLKKQCVLYDIELDISDFKLIDGKKFVFECGAGIHYYHISPEKIAYPCPLIEYTKFKNDFGVKLKSPKNIIEVWNSKEFKNWRKQQIIGCPNCKLRDKCARCPVQLDLLDKSIYEDIDFCLVK